MDKELFCESCGFEEDELYEYEGKKLCFDCLEKMANIGVQTTITYCANGEFFSEDEFYDMIEYLDYKVICNTLKVRRSI